ncbi:conserved hypothetical protein [Ricinus communis]|uniref:Uncharacterized protein n=1 Tax=Ricinus communis TaxID=3988 RepID=B9S072_RICCO|nr:conserved hypothetical protein [Ricinus communis]
MTHQMLSRDRERSQIPLSSDKQRAQKKIKNTTKAGRRREREGTPEALNPGPVCNCIIELITTLSLDIILNYLRATSVLLYGPIFC